MHCVDAPTRHSVVLACEYVAGKTDSVRGIFNAG